jgi:hypothetical protein
MSLRSHEGDLSGGRNPTLRNLMPPPVDARSFLAWKMTVHREPMPPTAWEKPSKAGERGSGR